ncbi:MAG: FHA domain-containing protein [Verrucomicrobiota bacterium]
MNDKLLLSEKTMRLHIPANVNRRGESRDKISHHLSSHSGADNKNNQTIKLGYFEFKNLKPWLEINLFDEPSYVELATGCYILGRMEENDKSANISLTNISIPDLSVSRMHCKIEVANNGIRISDLNSTNGGSIIRKTGEFINLKARKNIPLLEGDSITLGAVSCQMSMLGPNPSKPYSVLGRI